MLLQKIAGVEENRSDLYFIEFWKTPLTLKVIAFLKKGTAVRIYDFNNVVLYELDDSYYIKIVRSGI